MINDYNIDVQTLFLRMMVTNAELYTRVMNIMNSENFDRRLRPVAEFIIDHTKKYNVIPDPIQIKATTDVRYDGMFFEIVSLSEPKQIFGQIEDDRNSIEILAKCIKARKGTFNAT